MLSLTYPHHTPAHDLPAGAKMAALSLWTVLLFQLDSPWSLSIATLAALLTTLTCGAGFTAEVLRHLRPLWPFALIVALWHVWTADLSGGLAVLLRLAAAVIAANAVTMTTRLADIVAVLTRLATPLRPLGLSPRLLALSVALVIRFLPVLSQRATAISLAYRARTHRRPVWRLVLPVTLAALDDADRVAEALRARGGAG